MRSLDIQARMLTAKIVFGWTATGMHSGFSSVVDWDQNLTVDSDGATIVGHVEDYSVNKPPVNKEVAFVPKASSYRTAEEGLVIKPYFTSSLSTNNPGFKVEINLPLTGVSTAGMWFEMQVDFITITEPTSTKEMHVVFGSQWKYEITLSDFADLVTVYAIGRSTSQIYQRASFLVRGVLKKLLPAHPKLVLKIAWDVDPQGTGEDDPLWVQQFVATGMQFFKEAFTVAPAAVQAAATQCDFGILDFTSSVMAPPS